MYKIVANWKMYLTVQQSRNLAANFSQWIEPYSSKSLDFTLIPSDIALWDVKAQLEGVKAQLGAQNLAISKDLGAFTGQASPQQLIEAGVQEVLLGHSEVRTYLGERDQAVGQKVQVALEHGLKPIICIGETKEERDAGQQDAKIVQQLEVILSDIEDISQVVIAYEPRWAISVVSHGATCSPEDAAHMHQVIEHALHEFASTEVVAKIPILYGGSVNAESVLEYLEQPRVDGVLIGSASAKEESFKALIELLMNEYRG